MQAAASLHPKPGHPWEGGQEVGILDKKKQVLSSPCKRELKDTQKDTCLWLYHKHRLWGSGLPAAALFFSRSCCPQNHFPHVASALCNHPAAVCNFARAEIEACKPRSQQRGEGGLCNGGTGARARAAVLRGLPHDICQCVV